MKKIIFAIFISLICFKKDLFALTCKYDNPIKNSKDEYITIEYLEDVTQSKNGKYTCIDSSKSSVDIYLYNSSNVNLDQMVKNEEYGTILQKDGKKSIWYFEEDQFSPSACISMLYNSDDPNKMTCPSLGYGSVVTNNHGSVFSFKNYNECKGIGTGTGTGSNCNLIPAKEDNSSVIVDDGGGKTNVSVLSSCNIDFDMTGTKGRGDNVLKDKSIMIVKFYSDGSVKYTIDGSGEKTINLNSTYPINVYSEKQATYIKVSKDEINDLLTINKDDPSKSKCEKTTYSYWDKDDNSIKITTDEDNRQDYVEKSDEAQGIHHQTGGSAELQFPNTQISTKESTCTELLGGKSSPLVKFIQSAWTIVKVVAIVITVLFGVFDFLKATSNDKDVLMESVNKTIKRLIIVIIVLMLPTIIDIIGELLLNTKDILCGIR